MLMFPHCLPPVKTFLCIDLLNIIQMTEVGNTNDEIRTKIHQLKQELCYSHGVTSQKVSDLHCSILPSSFGLGNAWVYRSTQFPPMTYCLWMPMGRGNWSDTLHKQHAPLSTSIQFIPTWCLADGSTSRTWQTSI